MDANYIPLLNTKVGIIGMWMSCNYGAVMTSYALYRLVEQIGWDPILIDHSGKSGYHPRYRDLGTVFRKFIQEKKLKTTPVLSKLADFRALNSQLGTFLVGSDQVWRYQYNKTAGLFFFLDFVSPMRKKIAYGSSIGTQRCLAPAELRRDASMLLECFDGVSSRESSGVDILRQQYGVKAEFVLDPVFMCDLSCYEACCKDSSREIPGKPYVLSYILDPNEDKRRIIQHVVNREKKEMINMVDAQFEFEKKKQALNLPNVVDNLTVDDWVFYIKHCDHLVTDSFHGVCFAIIFNKPFTCMGHKGRGLARFTSLFELFGLTGRMVEYSATPEILDSLPEIDWEKVNTIRDEKKAASFEWLSSALKAKRPDSMRLNNIIVNNLIQMRVETDSVRRTIANHAIYDKLKSKFRYYWFMSKISWGKKRKKYKAKRKQALSLIKTIKKREREWLKAYCPE